MIGVHKLRPKIIAEVGVKPGRVVMGDTLKEVVNLRLRGGGALRSQFRTLKGWNFNQAEKTPPGFWGSKNLP